MREIKFRGKRIDNGEWVYGWYYEAVNYLDGNTKPMIVWINQVPSSIDRMIPAFEPIEWEVIPETVGQYTGLKDKNGKEIYEGDILHLWGGEYCQGYYEFNQIFTVKDLSDSFYLGECENIEVLGNIYENPELLKSLQ